MSSQEQKLQELTQQLNQRVGQLTSQDPLCCKLLGMIEVLREWKEANAKSDEEEQP